MATAFVGWYAGDENTLLGHTAPHVKTPTEKRRYFMDFNACSELLPVADGGGGDTIIDEDGATPPTVVSVPTGLTITEVAVATATDNRVEAWLAGGDEDIGDYWVVYTVTTVAGAVISRRGRLRIFTGED